jgi:hypothetical protein
LRATGQRYVGISSISGSPRPLVTVLRMTTAASIPDTMPATYRVVQMSALLSAEPPKNAATSSV